MFFRMGTLRFLPLLLWVISSVGAQAQITVNADQTAAALAQKLAGAGVQISNTVLRCAANANGSFTELNTGIGLDSGIVLTTGAAATSIYYTGVNGTSGLLASNNNGMPGDATLNSVSGQSTKDACALEFDFVPQGDSIHFQYVFSSEEYINATCGPYNDAFAFLISGAGINGQKNMALVPGTNIPVTINSVNSGTPGAGYSLANCTSMGPGSPFTSEYVDNSNGQYLTHKGRTTILDAAAAVQPCSTYHLKIVIADAGNYLYDSGVFLRAGSLQANKVSAEVVAPVNSSGKKFVVKGCAPATIRVSTTSARNYPRTVRLAFGGTAQRGTDFSVAADSIVIPANASQAQLSVTALQTPKNGTQTLKVLFHSPYSCDPNDFTDSISLLLYDSLSLSIRTPDTTICNNTGIQLQLDGDSLFQYSWSPTDFLSDAQSESPVASPNRATTYTVSATVPGAGCSPKTAQVSIAVKPAPTVQLQDLTACNFSPVSLQATVAPAYNGYSFLWKGPAGFSSTDASPLIPALRRADSGIYMVQVKPDTSNCTATDSMLLSVITPAPPELTSPSVFCQEDKTETLSATGEDLRWYLHPDGEALAAAPVVSTNELNRFQFFLSQTVAGCESERIPVNIDVKKCCDGIIIIPSAFSPNGDGRNDVFRVRTDFGYKVIQINVYNRWGQLVFHADSEREWNGTFQGSPAETGTYFYDILVACVNGLQTRKTGDLILLR